MVNLIFPILVGLLPLFGSFFNLPGLYLLNISLICLMVILVTKEWISKEYWSLYLFSIALSLVWSTSMYSSSLVGADIHTEYYFFREALDGWDTSLSDAYNSSILLGIILPFISNTFRVSGYFLFKAICPLTLAMVPVVQYKIFKRVFNENVAFLGSIFFISFVSFLIEIPGIVKMEVGFIFFALMVYFLLFGKSFFDYLLISLLGIVASTIHYTIGAVILLYLLISLISLLLLRLIFHLRYPFFKYLIVSIVSIMLVGGIYLGTVADGKALGNITALGGFFTGTTKIGYVDSSDGKLITKEYNPIKDVLQVPLTQRIKNLDPLIKGALGLDFLEVDIWGKIFRVLQWVTQLSLVGGLIYLIKNRKTLPTTYIGLSLSAFFTLGLSVFIPSFSSILNATRWYQIALFILAPLAIMEISILLKGKALPITLCILTTYLLFTTGFVFETTNSITIDKVSIPFSTYLSNYRLDTGSVYSINDITLVEYAHENNLEPIVSDFQGALLLGEYQRGLDPRIVLPRNLLIDEGTYLFLRERSGEEGILTFWENVGLRGTFTYEEIGINTLINKCKLVKQVGSAKIYLYGNDTQEKE